MARVAAVEASRKGAGRRERLYDSVAKMITMTMAAGATVSDQIVLPAGAVFRGVSLETETAFSGTPTNINFRAGTAAAGQQIVADVDVKAQGHTTATVVSSFGCIATFATADTTVYMQLSASGGTNPAGTCYAVVRYDVPVL